MLGLLPAFFAQFLGYLTNNSEQNECEHEPEMAQHGSVVLSKVKVRSTD